MSKAEDILEEYIKGEKELEEKKIYADPQVKKETVNYAKESPKVKVDNQPHDNKIIFLLKNINWLYVGYTIVFLFALYILIYIIMHIEMIMNALLIGFMIFACSFGIVLGIGFICSRRY